MLTVSAWHKCMYVQVQGQGGWSAPYPTCNQVISLCSYITLVIKQPVPLWQIYLLSLCLCGSGNAPLFNKARLLESCRHRGVKSTLHPWSRGNFSPFSEPHFGNGIGYVSFTPPTTPLLLNFRGFIHLLGGVGCSKPGRLHRPLDRSGDFNFFYMQNQSSCVPQVSSFVNS